MNVHANYRAPNEKIEGAPINFKFVLIELSIYLRYTKNGL